MLDDYITELSKKYTNVTHLATSQKAREQIDNNIKVKLYNGITFVKNILSIRYVFDSLKLCKGRTVNIHFPFIPGAIVGALLTKDTKIIVTWHCDVVLAGLPKLIYALLVPLVESTLKKSSKIIVTSQNIIDSTKLLKKYKDKCNICHIPLKPLNNDIKTKKIIGLPREYIIFIGRLVDYKGLKVIINLYSNHSHELPPIVLAGQGPLSKDLIKLSKHNPTKVIFIDRIITEEEKNYLIENSRFLVFPSNTRAEAFGVVQLEAMRYGKPVINTELGTGTSYVSKDGVTGITVRPNSVNELKKAIIDLYDDKKMQTEFSKNAKERIKTHFSYEKFANNLIKIFDV